MKQAINTPNAPAAIGPYSQAILSGDLVFCSGQIAICPETSELVTGNVGEETTQVMNNAGAVLREAGCDFSDVIKVGIFLKNLDDFSTVNEVYAQFFSEPYPARACVEVSKLPKDVNVEIEMIARKK